MPENRKPCSSRPLPVGWTITLSLDFLATLLVAVVLCAVGALLPNLTEDDVPATAPTSPGALGFFLTALALVSSLVVTAGLFARARTERSRTLALWVSAGRLALLVLSTAAFVTYGVITIELA
ncbi:hypothetical protein ACFVGY_35805 [Streptomyces sp. NPDC127106]|uniref:hypothetical protein n=1 Tax=Streptomyces sp. NPDC127106 TaxID=3345360 RepID=UPI00363BD86A